MLQILKTLVLPLSVWMGTILRALRSTLLHTGANVIKMPVYHGALGEQMILGSPTPLAVALLSEYQSPFLSPVRPGPSGSVRVVPLFSPCFEAENERTLWPRRLRIGLEGSYSWRGFVP